MDFRELTYITAVADNRSVTEAARQLYISQPSLSYIISKVEEDLGVKLFDRRTNPISLTYAGERYVKTAKEILVMKDNLRRELSDIGHGQKGRINIGIPTERAGYMLPKVIGEFKKSYPNIKIYLQESKSEEIINNLINDKIAFCILPGGKESLPPGVKTEYIYSEKLYLVAAKGMVSRDMIIDNSIDDGIPVADLKLLNIYPFIMMKRGQYIRHKVDDIFRRFDYIPKEVMEVSSCISATQLAGAGLGITIVPERAIEPLKNAGFEVFNYSEESDSWDVNIVYKEGVYLDEAERALIRTMREVFARYQGIKPETMK
ncbi:LysR family transcriptional regulator [Oribacterium sp. WCC10]|uniref:LysR family transcriptional regulator n=1 Tax=Oribacterium sp. WCC10 TaxID=1855343 RepID=UPI0008E0BFBC|nr:LysR family transcriptional regulator [Oribacterium sp. WCC10]SFG53066.1 DNA-binding transcriptional regulator, LysR family [Oribacterium sp. WCC10]